MDELPRFEVLDDEDIVAAEPEVTASTKSQARMPGSGSRSAPGPEASPCTPRSARPSSSGWAEIP